jgi:photosystem II stability/assembly factor-like uncharacterized protein
LDNLELDSAELPQNLIFGLAVSPQFGRHAQGACFAACSEGLMISRDGSAWKNAFDNLNPETSSIITALVISPEFEKDGCLVAGASGGVVRSLDGGKTWSSSFFPAPAPMVSCLAISPDFEQDGVLFAGTMEDGVLFSTDRGSRWAAWNFGLLDLNVLSLAISPDFAHDETLLVGTETGLFRSTNGGRAWREVPLPAGELAITALAISPGFSSDRTLYVGSDGSGLFVSHDSGKTWQRLGEPAGIESVNQIILTSPTGQAPKIWALTSAGLLLSEDQGQAWQVVFPAEDEGELLCAACSLPEGGLLVGYSGFKMIKI